MAQTIKNPSAVKETWVPSLDWEDSLDLRPKKTKQKTKHSFQLPFKSSHWSMESTSVNQGAGHRVDPPAIQAIFTHPSLWSLTTYSPVPRARHPVTNVSYFAECSASGKGRKQQPQLAALIERRDVNSPSLWRKWWKFPSLWLMTGSGYKWTKYQVSRNESGSNKTN